MGLNDLTPEDYAIAKMLATEGDWELWGDMMATYVLMFKSPFCHPFDGPIFIKVIEKLKQNDYSKVTKREYEELIRGMYAAEDTAVMMGNDRDGLLFREIFNVNEQMKVLIQKYGIIHEIPVQK